MSIDPKFMQILLNTFHQELTEQLQQITDGLLELEDAPSEEERKEILNSVFRSAHNIKGAARGVDSKLVGEIAHRLESLFSKLRQTNEQPTAELIDLCLRALDSIKQVVEDEKNEKPCSVDTEALFKQLETALDKDKAQKEKQDSEPLTIDVEADSTTIETAEPSESTPAHSETEHETTQQDSQERDQVSNAEPVTPDIDKVADEAAVPHAEKTPEAPVKKTTPEQQARNEVIRVSTDKLNKVLALAGELQVAKISMQDHFDSMQELTHKISRIESRVARYRPVVSRADSRIESEEIKNVLVDNMEGIESLRSQAIGLSKSMRATNSRMSLLTNALQNDIRMLRLVPVSTILKPLSRIVRDLARDLNKKVKFTIENDHIEMDRAVLEGLKDPLMHLLRNSLDHGLEPPDDRVKAGKTAQGELKISVASAGGQVQLTVSDDGQGIDKDKIGSVALKKKLVTEEELDRMEQDQVLDLIFRPGFSSKELITEVSGRGVGLDVVRANLRELNGTVLLSTTLGSGTQFTLQLPLTLTTERGLQLRAGGEELVIPSTSVDRILEVPVSDIMDVSASQAIMMDGRPIPLRDLAALLSLPQSEWKAKNMITLVVISKGWNAVALLVDEVVGEREIVIKRLQPPLISVRNVSGATLTGGGDIMMVLNVNDLVKSANINNTRTKINSEEEKEQVPLHILVVDDSITTRTLEKNILETQGYRVTTAIDGQKAWQILNENNDFSLVVTDVEMPNMTGFELTDKIKSDAELREIPVIIVTSLANEDDKAKGVEVGADAYIVKGTIETQALIDVVNQLI